MDSPQYLKEVAKLAVLKLMGFKPYYKWIVLNTELTYQNGKSIFEF